MSQCDMLASYKFPKVGNNMASHFVVVEMKTHWRIFVGI